MDRSENRIFGIFTIVSGLLGFTVDTFALFQLFGIEFLITPKISINFPNVEPQPIIIFGEPLNIEAVTFVILLYVIIVTFLIAQNSIMKPWKLGLIGDVTALGLSIFTPILLVMWFWAFGYISLWIYRFTLPALAILGISWFTEATGWRNKRASTLGNILLWLELGIGILWFRAAIDDWSIFLIAALSFLVWLIGRYAGRFIADWT